MGEESKSKLGLITVTFLILFTSSYFIIQPVDGKKCPGKCISNTTMCKLKGGKIAGYCTNEMACCDFTFRKIGHCGSKMTNLTTAYFRSPDYPDYSSGDLICQFDFTFYSNASGLVVEFSEITMDGSGFVKNSECESDMIFFKGFPDWTPPAQCGNLTNYAAVIELGELHTKGMKTLTLLAIMSSKKYRWNVKVSQLYQDRKTREGRKNSSMKRPLPEDYADSEEDGGDYDIEGRAVKSFTSSQTSIFHTSESQNVFKNNNEETEEEEIFRLAHIARLAGSTSAISSPLGNPTDYADEGRDYGEALDEETFIVNGNNTQISSIPWQASLRSMISSRAVKLLPSLGIKNCSISEGLHFCGGTIISNRHILTAVHCFALGEKLSTWQRLSSMKVVLGDSNLCDEKKEGIQEFKVDKVYYHYGYDDAVILNDIVVIKLKERIKFTEKIKPIKLALEGTNFEQRIAMVSGWGLTNLTAPNSKQSSPEQLQFAADLFIGNRSYCSKQQMNLYPSMKRVQLIRYPKYINVFNSLLCTYVRNGSVARVVGQGDSGGPLVVFPEKVVNFTEAREPQEPVLAGVISYMIPIPNSKRPHDVSNYVDFYQSVSFFRNWIELAMQ